MINDISKVAYFCLNEEAKSSKGQPEAQKSKAKKGRKDSFRIDFEAKADIEELPIDSKSFEIPQESKVLVHKNLLPMDQHVDPRIFFEMSFKRRTESALQQQDEEQSLSHSQPQPDIMHSQNIQDVNDVENQQTVQQKQGKKFLSIQMLRQIIRDILGKNKQQYQEANNVIGFSDIMKDIPRMLRDNQEASLQTCFVTLLHLANENFIKIQPNQHDMTISFE